MRYAIAIVMMLCIVGVGRAEEKKPVPKPPTVTPQEWGSEPQPIPDERRHTPKFITIHHAGVIYKPETDPAKFVKNMQIWGQRDKNWPDLPYHFLIAPDGRIFEGRSLEYEPETNTRYELQGHIGVELMGSFGRQRVSEAQLKSLVPLLAWLSDSLEIEPDQIAGHNDRAPGQTSCPGPDLYRYISDGILQDYVRRIRAGENPEVELLPPLPNGPTIFVGEPLPEEPN